VRAPRGRGSGSAAIDSAKALAESPAAANLESGPAVRAALPATAMLTVGDLQPAVRRDCEILKLRAIAARD